MAKGGLQNDTLKGSYTYVEPKDYFPKSLRKELGIGEYNKDGKRLVGGLTKKPNGKSLNK